MGSLCDKRCDDNLLSRGDSIVGTRLFAHLFNLRQYTVKDIFEDCVFRGYKSFCDDLDQSKIKASAEMSVGDAVLESGLCASSVVGSLFFLFMM